VTAGTRTGRWPWPYTQEHPGIDPRPLRITIVDPEAWLATQLERPFETCHALAENGPACLHAYAAATFQPVSDAPEPLHPGPPPGFLFGEGQTAMEGDEDEEDEHYEETFAHEEDGWDSSSDEHVALADVTSVEWGGGQLAVGQRIEARDSAGVWYVARVVGFRRDEAGEVVARVHFEGWDDVFDEWLSVRGPPIRPFDGLTAYGPNGSEEDASRRAGAVGSGTADDKSTSVAWRQLQVQAARVLSLADAAVMRVPLLRSLYEVACTWAERAMRLLALPVLGLSLNVAEVLLSRLVAFE